jgi:hypothetical protein
MLEKLTDLPAGLQGLEAVGKVSREDYERVFEPLIDEARREGHRIRFLYQFGPRFDGITPGGAWEDAKMGLRSMRLFEGCAIVSDVPWLRESARVVAWLLPCPVAIFADQDRASAIEWLQALPKGATHRLLPDCGVIVFELDAALRAQDFDALALTADTWIEQHEHLQGLVIHAREFPGWESFGSFLRHLQFVRNHHRSVRRIAFAADSKLASFAPRLAQHFVEAAVMTFDYDDMDSAVAWAKGGPDSNT